MLAHFGGMQGLQYGFYDFGQQVLRNGEKRGFIEMVGTGRFELPNLAAAQRHFRSILRSTAFRLTFSFCWQK
jgi:hypothetical protein